MEAEDELRTNFSVDAARRTAVQVASSPEPGGEIVAIDAETRIIQVQTDADVIDVQISDATTISADDDSDDGAEGDADTPLAFEILAVGQTVEVEGIMPVSGPMDAVSVEVEDDAIDTTTL